VKTDDELRPKPTEPEDQAGLPHDRIMQVGQTKPPDRRITLFVFVGLILLLARAGGWPLLIVVLALVVMICLHELGHFVTAKLSGMKVTEFFLGFGPKLWSFRRGETEYGIKAIPAGAYVRIIGMNNLEEVAPEDEPRTYRAQTYPRRLLVGVAGSAMHFLQALLCLFLLLAFTGTPGGHIFQQDTHYWRVVDVVDGSAAKAAGLQPGDRVTSVDGTPITDFSELRDIVTSRPGQPVQLSIDRHGEQLTVTTVLGSEDGKGKLGVQSSTLPPSETVGVVTAAGRSFVEFGAGVRESISALGRLFSPSGISNFASQVANGGGPTVNDTSGGSPGTAEPSSNSDRPISIWGAAGIGSDLTRDGLFGFLAFFLSINLFIGIVNLVPLLPLDGGHVIIATYERIRSRKGRRYQVDVMKLLPLTYAVVLLLGLLFVSTLYLDLVDPIRLN
jgi:membrane-associated protease RseP (regulator of RpoE activity)